MENPIIMDDLGVPPILGNHHVESQTNIWLFNMVPRMDLKGCGGFCVLLGAMLSLMLQPPNILPSGALTSV